MATPKPASSSPIARSRGSVRKESGTGPLRSRAKKRPAASVKTSALEPTALANSTAALRQGRTVAGGRLVEGRVVGRVVVVSATRLAPCPPVLFTTLPQSYGAELSPFGAKK